MRHHTDVLLAGLLVLLVLFSGACRGTGGTSQEMGDPHHAARVEGTPDSEDSPGDRAVREPSIAETTEPAPAAQQAEPGAARAVPTDRVRRMEDFFTPESTVFWIGGAADKRPMLGHGPHHIMLGVMNRLGEGLPGDHHYRGFDDREQIIREIHAVLEQFPDRKIVLIGHSFGGAASMRIARELESSGHPASLVITVDPVWPFLFFPPEHCECWINVYQEFTVLDYLAQVPLAGPPVAGVISFLVQGLWGNMSDTIATTGRQIGHQSPASINIPVKLHHGAAGPMVRLAFDQLRKEETADSESSPDAPTPFHPQPERASAP